MMTTYGRGILQGWPVTALMQLEAKFGPLSPAAKQRVEALTLEELHRLAVGLLKAQSLAELGLPD